MSAHATTVTTFAAAGMRCWIAVCTLCGPIDKGTSDKQTAVARAEGHETGRGL